MERMPLGIKIAFVAMTIVVVLSNYLVQFHINNWVTYGNFCYPISFLITELTNRFFGPKKARHVVYLGFFVGVILSIWTATPRIAFASGTAFLMSQLLDIAVFTRLRQKAWWCAPFFASFFASILDSAWFWSFAFWGTGMPVLTLMIGDFALKFTVDVAMLTPFRFIIRKYQQQTIPLQGL